MKIFKNYYKFPLKLDDVIKDKAWTHDDSMAFDFADHMYGKGRPHAKLSLSSRHNIVNCINGTYTMKHPHTYIRENEEIFVKLGNHKLLIIVLRGWGDLTGRGIGHGLTEKEATKVQNAFGDYIIKRLSTKSRDKDEIVVG